MINQEFLKKNYYSVYILLMSVMQIYIFLIKN